MLSSLSSRIAMALFAMPALFAAAETNSFTVTALSLGSDANRETTPAGIQSFISRLDGRAGFAASPSSVPSARWDACPDGVKPDRWVSLVPACFGTRTDWLAFAFDAAGHPLFAVRRPARLSEPHVAYPESIPPGANQIDRNAGIELAADFGTAWAAGSVQGRPGLALTVEAETNSGDEALPMMPAEIEGLRAIAVAAALQAGCRPGTTPAAASAALKISKAPSAYGLALEWKDGTGQPRRLLKRASQDALYPYLVRMIRGLSGWGGAVSDFCLTDPGGVRVVGWRNDTAYLDLGEAMTAFSAANATVEWTATQDARYRPAYTMGPWGGTNPAPIQYHPAIVRLGKNGEIGRGPSGADALPWGFDSLPNGGFLVAQDLSIGASDPATFLFRWLWTGADRLQCGPLLADKRALVGGLSGEMVALNAADGTLLWRTQVVERLSGPLVRLGETVVAPSLEGVLTAFRIDTGTVVWRADLGDTLLGVAAPVPQGLVAATRSGRVALLDPATGAVRASWEGGSPAVGCGAQEAGVAWAGRNGRVVILKLPDLKPVRETALGTKLTDGALAVTDAPHVWGGGEEFGKRGPVALVADEEGFVYVLPIP